MIESKMDLLRKAAANLGLPVIGEEPQGLLIATEGCCSGYLWNPYAKAEDRFEMAQKLPMCLDFINGLVSTSNGTYGFNPSDSQSIVSALVIAAAYYAR